MLLYLCDWVINNSSLVVIIMYIINLNLYECCNKLWKVNPKGSGLRTDILKSLLTMFNLLIETHSKLFVFRFDLHLRNNIEPKKLSRFFENLGRSIKSRYDSKMYYFWVREQVKANFQHYHVVFFMKGSVIQEIGFLEVVIKKYWDKHGTYSRCNFHQVERAVQHTIDNASEHISYLAKVRDKEKNPPASKNFGHSRFFT